MSGHALCAAKAISYIHLTFSQQCAAFLNQHSSGWPSDAQASLQPAFNMLLTVHIRLLAKLNARCTRARTLQATSHPAVVSRAPAIAPYPDKQHFVHVFQHLIGSLVSTAATPSQQNSSRQVSNLTKGITSNHSISSNRDSFASQQNDKRHHQQPKHQ